MSESAHNPLAQAKRRGELAPLTRQRRDEQSAERETRSYLRYLAGQIESPEHFERVIADVNDHPPGMRSAVREQLMQLLPPRVVREIVTSDGDS